MDEIAVRWGNLKDWSKITRMLGLNSMSAQDVPKETYIVAEEKGEILAVGRCLVARKHLVLGPLTVDPWAGEHRFAVALYSGVGTLAQEIGLREVWVDCDEHQEYLLEACYRRRVGGWHLDTTQSFGAYERLPERGWRRVLSLWSAVQVPFFRAFGA
jgi:hypothetical protein